MSKALHFLADAFDCYKYLRRYSFSVPKSCWFLASAVHVILKREIWQEFKNGRFKR